MPLQYIRAHAATSTFDRDSYFVQELLNIVPSLPNGIFDLDPAWLTSCGNANNGVIQKPERAFVVSPNVEDEFTINLTSPPVDKLGLTTLSFKPQPNADYPCTDCVQFSSSLIFTSSNWNAPQKVLIKYVKNGDSKYLIVGEGGGYEYQRFPQSFVVVSKS